MGSNLLSNGHLLIVCNQPSRERGRCFLKEDPLRLSSSSGFYRTETQSTFQSDPCNLDLHLDNILSKAGSRLYILRVCKFYGLPLDHPRLLFTSLILPIFTYAVQVWGCAYYHKYLSRIDRLFKRAFKLDYCKELF